MKTIFTNLLEKKGTFATLHNCDVLQNIMFKVTERHKRIINIDILQKELETFYF